MGAPTAATLLSTGRRVVVMSRGQTSGQGTDGRRPVLPAGCETVICDRDIEDAFINALCSPTCPRIVIDFTAMSPAHIESVKRAHLKRPLQHYVFVSTNMVYPGGVEAMDLSPMAAAGQRVDEASVRRDMAGEAPANYGGQKLKCEALLAEAAMELGSRPPLPSTVIRPPAVVGAGCDSRHEKLHRFVAGLRPLPPPERVRPGAALPGHRFRVACANDVASVLAAVVDRSPIEPAEAFNVASGDSKGVTMDEYAEALAAALPVRLEPPGASVVVPGDANLRNYEKQGVLDTSRAERVLGFRPTPLDTFMEAVVAWHAPLLSTDA